MAAAAALAGQNSYLPWFLALVCLTEWFPLNCKERLFLLFSSSSFPLTVSQASWPLISILSSGLTLQTSKSVSKYALLSLEASSHRATFSSSARLHSPERYLLNRVQFI